MGLFLDNIIFFLFWRVVRLIKEKRSNAWPSADGKVVRAYPQGASIYPAAEVAYKYTVEGKTHTGMHTMAFWLSSSAKEYAGRFLPGTTIVVRYKPGKPTVSVVREHE
jgi:hypothetical protein